VAVLALAGAASLVAGEPAAADTDPALMAPVVPMDLVAAGPLAAPGPQTACIDVGPPCGYITPLMDIDLPAKPMCGLGKIRFSEEDRANCLPLPANGGSVVLEGTLTWGWKISDDGVYPNDPMTDIVINFPGASGTPDWMDVQVEPSEFRISTATLADPQYLVTDTTDPAAPVFWYHFERPIKVTVTRTGDPTAEDLAKLHSQRQPPPDIQPVFVKARSNPSGNYYTSAFAVDIIQFDARVPTAGLPVEKDSPAPQLLAVLAAAVLLARRLR